MTYDNETTTYIKLEINEELHQRLDLGIFEIDAALLNHGITEANCIAKTKSIHLLKNQNAALKEKDQIVFSYKPRFKRSAKESFNKQ